ncbi:MAG: type II toxin-antitoxin system HigA family antitoxin [Phycisphaerales bacterium JB039]
MATTRKDNTKLPGRFEDLVREMPPRAIVDDVQHANTVEMIDRLMASGKLTKGQESYLETLVQLVERYEAEHHAIEGASGLETLKYLLAEHGINATGLAQILGVHASMGSKILKGERSLTIEHVKVFAARFGVGVGVFVD